MLESIKKFLIGEPTPKDDNRIFQGDEKPKTRGGLLFWPQLAKGDIWVDTVTNQNTTYWFDGKVWERVTS